MSHHDIHQYYFEKYLRNEMQEKDRLAFEEKLSVDEMLRRAFEHYKLNRTQFLENLFIEEEQKGQGKVNSWIYLFISVTGIILAVHFYMDNRELRSAQQFNTEKPLPFYKRIPFISKNEPAPAKPEVKPESKRGEALPETSDADTLIPEMEPETETLTFNTDRLLHDTTLIAIDRAFYETRYLIIKAATDSLISDSLMEKLAIKSALRNPGQAKPQNFEVEFWISPIHYRGYLFNGKKLLVYGIQNPGNINLYTENDQLLLHMDGNEITLINDKEFHKF